MTIKELESDQKILSNELEKCHAHIEQQNKCIKLHLKNCLDIQDLKNENKYIPQLSTKIKECSNKIEEISIEIDKEKQKNAKLINDNEALEQEMENLKNQFSGENSPEYLKQQIEIHKAYMEELELAKENNLIKIEQIEQELKKITTSYEEELENIGNYLRSVILFIETAFADLKPNISMLEKADIQDKSILNKNIGYCFSELKNSIKGTREVLSKNWILLENENEALKNELGETRESRNDLASELDKMKIVLEQQIKLNKDKDDTIRSISDEIIKQKEINDRERKTNIIAEEQQAEFLRDFYDKLISVAGKYEGVDFVTARVNIRSSPNKEANRVFS